MSQESSEILVIEDDAIIRENLAELLDAEGYAVRAAGEGKQGLAMALQRRPDLVLCDIMMPVMDGYQVLHRLRDYPPTTDVPFIFLTAKADAADRSRGMRLGADDYITKPYGRRDLLDRVAARLARFRSAHAATAPTAQTADDNAPVVVSPAMQQVVDQARQLARTPLSILLLGETGVGKDVLAHTIHRASPRAGQPFVPLHAASLSESLIESELFGHERGAFTGAVASRAGVFEQAHGGTIFLDELGELPIELQPALLRVLEQREVRRVGDRRVRSVDVRVVAATNRDLQQLVKEGRFREDLYYRLAVVEVHLPPLRDRTEDFALLVEHLLHTASFDHSVRGIAPDVEQLFRAYHWPGNVRELRNTLLRAIPFCEGDLIDMQALPEALLEAPMASGDPEEEEVDALPLPASDLSLREAKDRLIQAFERRYLEDLLERCDGNLSKAARDAGVDRKTISRMLKRHGIRP